MDWLIKNPSNDFYNELAQELESDLSQCRQCGLCTSVCPTAPWADVTPSMLIKLVLSGEQERSVRADMNWLCNSCDSCTNICPERISPRELMSSLKRLSFIHGYSDETMAPVEMIPLLYEATHQNLGYRGRIWFTSLAVAYKMKTFDFFEDTPKALSMAAKGLMKLFPPKASRERRALLSRIRSHHMEQIAKELEEAEAHAAHNESEPDRKEPLHETEEEPLQ